MEITNMNSLFIFVLLFIPGFVSIKVYDLLIANDLRDFSKSFFEVLAYGAVNFAILSWWIIPICGNDYYLNHPYFFAFSAICILFVAPIIWPIVYVWLLKWPWLNKRIIHPVKRPWDWFFTENNSVWVIVNLADGTKIGGVYSDNSYTSSYPLKEQIYLEEVWKLDENDKFIEPVPNTKGILIIGKDISSIEFFDWEMKK